MNKYQSLALNFRKLLSNTRCPITWIIVRFFFVSNWHFSFLMPWTFNDKIVYDVQILSSIFRSFTKNCIHIFILHHFFPNTNEYLHEKTWFFFFIYKNHCEKDSHLFLDQYINTPNTMPVYTFFVPPPIQVRHKSDNPSAY